MREHETAQLDALSRLTFQEWFNGRAAFVHAHSPVAADFGEQAMRADYLADKGWWYRIYEPQAHPTLAEGVAAASTELPTPTGSVRSMRRGWLERIDLAVTAAARRTPSSQWATTLIPQDIIEELRRGEEQCTPPC